MINDNSTLSDNYKVSITYSDQKPFNSLEQLKYAIINMNKPELLSKLQHTIDCGYKLILEDNNE